MQLGIQVSGLAIVCFEKRRRAVVKSEQSLAAFTKTKILRFPNLYIRTPRSDEGGEIRRPISPAVNRSNYILVRVFLAVDATIAAPFPLAICKCQRPDFKS
jgi:hypothetical protein